MPFLSPEQQFQSTDRKNITCSGLAYPELTWGLPALPLTTGCLGGGLPRHSSALWFQYPKLLISDTLYNLNVHFAVTVTMLKTTANFTIRCWDTNVMITYTRLCTLVDAALKEHVCRRCILKQLHVVVQRIENVNHLPDCGSHFEDVWRMYDRPVRTDEEDWSIWKVKRLRTHSLVTNYQILHLLPHCVIRE